MKLYYDCPIEAAYMAKNFGAKLRLELIDAETGIIDLQQFPITSWHTLTSLFGTTGLSPYFYIHPDSLHIFKPQEGDFCTWEKNKYIDTFTWCELADYAAINSEIKIIQRDNKPFITPKQEN